LRVGLLLIFGAPRLTLLLTHRWRGWVTVQRVGIAFARRHDSRSSASPLNDSL